MTSYLIRRLAYALFVLWGAMSIVFVTVRIVPGDPASMMLGAGATEEDVAALRARLGLDDAMPVQYAQFMADVARFDFGQSLWLNRPVLASLAERITTTGRLALAAMAIALLLS